MTDLSLGCTLAARSRIYSGHDKHRKLRREQKQSETKMSCMWIAVGFSGTLETTNKKRRIKKKTKSKKHEERRTEQEEKHLSIGVNINKPDDEGRISA
jgi:hypothetical protein